MSRLIAVFTFNMLISGFFCRQSFAYDIPQRQININPYVSFMFPNKLIRSDNLDNPLENKIGVGFGVKTRTQLFNSWGLVINTSFTDLKVNNNSLSTATIFTAGLFYKYQSNLGRFTFDVGYGVISVADLSAALLLPNFEYSREISERISISAELGMSIANDWFYNYGVKENLNSVSFSVGGLILF